MLGGSFAARKRQERSSRSQADAHAQAVPSMYKDMLETETIRYPTGSPDLGPFLIVVFRPQNEALEP